MKEKQNKFRIKIVIIASFVILFLFGSVVYCAQPRRIDEAALELEMANRLEVMLEKIIGKERSLVKIDLKVSYPASGTELLEKRLRGLPGVGLPESKPKEPKAQGTPFSATPTIESISVILYLDKTLPTDKVELVRTSVPKWLELDFTRGDSLKIELIPWKEVPPEDIAVKQLSFLKRNLWVIAGIAILVIFGFLLFLLLFMPTRKFIKERAKIKPEEAKKMPDLEALLHDLKDTLTKATGATSGKIDTLLEDIKEILAKAPTRMDSLLEEIKDTLEKMAQTQPAGGGVGTAAPAPVPSLQASEFLAALREAVVPLTEGGTGISPEAVEALKKIEDLMRRQVEATTSASKAIDEPFKYLNTLSPKEISLFIEGETPRLAAILLGHISPNKSGTILDSMPEEKRLETSMAMATLVESDEVATEIKDFLQRKMPQVKLRADFSPIQGTKALAGILSAISYNIATSILQEIEKRSPSLSKAVKTEMFLFEDIVNLNDNVVLELLKSIDKSRIALALSISSDKVKEKFYRNMTERAVSMLKEEIEALGRGPTEGGPKKIVFFEDILDLDARSIQNIFKTINRDTLKIALKGASEEVRQKFYSVMTERGAAMLKEDIEVMPPISGARSEEAQKKILEEIQKLEKESFAAQQEILEKIKELERAGRISLTSKEAKLA